MVTKLGSIVPANKRNLSRSWEECKDMIPFNFVTKAVSSVKNLKNTHLAWLCVFLLLLRLMDQHQVWRGGVWNMWANNLGVENFWITSGLKSGGSKLKKARNVVFGSFLTLLNPSPLESLPNLKKGVVLLFPIGQIYQKWAKWRQKWAIFFGDDGRPDVGFYDYVYSHIGNENRVFVMI